MATSLVARFRRNELAVAADPAVVVDPVVVAALVVAAAPVVVAAPVVAAESVVAEPVAGVVESMRVQAERIGLSPVQRLLCRQKAVSRSPLS
jgi:hypothetical protein